MIILETFLLSICFLGSTLVNAGLYVPSRSYVFYIPKGLTPDDPVGVIRTLDSWAVPCSAESELRLQADQRSNLTASWEGTDIVLKVMSSAESWTAKETLSLSLAIECDWRGRQFEGYYKPLTSSTLTFHPVDIGAGQPRKKKAPPARTQADLLKRSCPAKLQYDVVENSGPGSVDHLGGLRLYPGLDIWLTCDSCKQLTINETSRDLVLISPPDRETDQVIQVTVRCSLGRRRDDGQWPAESRDVAVTVSVLDMDDSHPHTLYGATQQLVEKETAIKIGETFDITVIDDDGLTITNNNSYRVEINDTLGLIVPGRTEFRDNRGKTLIKSHFTMKNNKPVADNYTVEVVLENWSYRPHGDPVMSKKFVTRYLIHNTTIHVIKPPTVNLDIAAAKYSMLTALRSESEETSRETNYILQKTQLMDLQDVVTVTRSGHIYVNDSARLRSTHQTMAHLVVKETQKEIITKEFILNIRLTDNISKRGNRPCDGGCAIHQTKDTCVTSCGYGAVLGVCQWDVRKHVANYSQCTPSVETCPDEFCSELEMLNVHICPQDCEEGAPRRNRTVIPLDLEETNQNECLHDSGPCVSSAGQTEDESEEVVCSISCKTGLAVSMSILLIAAVVLGLGLTAWNRTRKREPMALKHVSSLVSMAAVPSDYIVDDARDTRQHANRPNSSPASGQCPAKIALGQDVFEDKWEFPRCYLTLEHVIGEGEFGQVVRAQAFMLNGQEGNSVVAVKMLKPDASGAEYQDLVSEFQLLKEVDHPNVIKLFGVCTQKGPLYVIVEYCELGSLRSFLRSAKLKSRGRSWEDKQRSGGSDASPQAINFTRTLTFRDLLSFAWQISKGMDYLASLKIVHRDLAARNVLVTEGLKMKISDFGLSRDVYEADAYLKMSKGRMPVKWMAPESLYAQIYTTKSDVWSYGIVLWEVVTLGASPYPGIPPERLFPLLSTGYRMDRPEDCPDELYAIMQKCWKAEPENRPHFSTLREILDHLLQQNTEYLELSESKYFLSSLEIDDRRAKVSPSYGNVCSLNKCQPDAYVSSNWPGEELGDNECPEMSKLLIPCENDLEVTKRHIYCNDGPKICDRLLVHENLTYV